MASGKVEISFAPGERERLANEIRKAVRDGVVAAGRMEIPEYQIERVKIFDPKDKVDRYLWLDETGESHWLRISDDGLGQGWRMAYVKVRP